jgi:hypothetical protein
MLILKVSLDKLFSNNSRSVRPSKFPSVGAILKETPSPEETEVEI